MNVKRLYEIFQTNDAEVYTSDQLNRLLEDDTVKLQTAVIGVQHFLAQIPIFKKWYPQHFELNFPGIQHKAFSKLYSFLEGIDLIEFSKREFSYYPDEIKVIQNALQHLLTYFESQEDYLKCATIKKLQDILEGCSHTV